MLSGCQIPNPVHDLNKLLIVGYIDPGSGYVFNSILPAVIGFFSTFIFGFFWSIKKRALPVFQRNKRPFFVIIFLLLFVLIAGVVINIKNNKDKTIYNKKTIVLGIDGLDPKLIDYGIKKGLLPNLKKLKEEGYYRELKTTVPPQSPVAWASFATGLEPSEHGIYDFIVRNPDNYQLDLVWSEKSADTLAEKSFWRLASEKKIPLKILFLPNTFSPTELNGQMISGMGTPDVLGTAGKFTLFTSGKINQKSRGKQINVVNNDLIKINIEGPKYNVLGAKKTTLISASITKIDKGKRIKISVQNQNVILQKNQFSDWVRLEFKIDFFTRIHSIAKFYLKEIGPDFKLYLSPLNFDPTQPVKPISYPESYSKTLAKDYGLFYTQGLPHDTWAYEEGIFDKQTFLKNTEDIFKERIKIYFGELAKFKSGILFNYIGTTDTISHMFWNDPEIIMSYYNKIDQIIGQTLKKIDKKDKLIILSDHGFAGFDYEFNLNSWLRDSGYLTLKKGHNGGELLDNIDWSKTKIYAIGYNGIYFNLKDREKLGIVDKKEIEGLTKELKEKLLEIKNPQTNQNVIKHIYTRGEMDINEDDKNAPDIFVGYYAGIRSSWDTAVGATPDEVFLKRISKWNGDHLFDPTEVPGVLFSNKPTLLDNPKITDVTKIILRGM